jgi:predicted transcriptional regulator of viral defense system
MSRPSVTERHVFSLLSKEGRNSVDLKIDAALLSPITVNPSDLLWRLQKKGLAHRVQGGRYLVSVDGQASRYPRVDLLEPLAGLILQRLEMPYLISWHSALWRHGLIDQQSLRLYVAVAKRKRPARVGRISIQFVTVSPESLIDPEAGQFRVASVEKAL